MRWAKCIRIAKILLLLLGIFFLLSTFLTWFTWGTPWELKKAMSAAQQYVDLKYESDMIVTGGYRFLRGNRYVFKVYSGTTPTFYFQISFDTEDYANAEDNYYSTAYRYLLMEPIQEQAVSRYGKDVTVNVKIERLSCLEVDQNGQWMPLSDFLQKYAQHYSIEIDCGDDIAAADEFLEQTSDIILDIYNLGMEPDSVTFSFFAAQDEKKRIVLTHDEIVSAISSQSVLSLLENKLV